MNHNWISLPGIIFAVTVSLWTSPSHAQPPSAVSGSTTLPGKTAMVIVVEENEAQAYSMTQRAFFSAIERVLDLPLKDLDLDMPDWLEKAIRASSDISHELLRAVRKGFVNMLRDVIEESHSALGGTPQNCFADALKALSAGIDLGPKPGKVFLDKYGEAFYASCLQQMAAPYYQKVVVLTDKSAQFPQFKQTLEALHSEGYLIDVFLDVHGCGRADELNNRSCSQSKLLFANGEANLDTIKGIGGGKQLNLNAVFMVSCWGSEFNQTWLDLGAKGSNGSRELNYYVLLTPLALMHYWTKGGMTLSDAATKAYRLERAFINGKKAEIKFAVRNPITGNKKTATIGTGVTWRKLMDRVLSRQYGDDKSKPVNNEASSARISAGDPSVRRAGH